MSDTPRTDAARLCHFDEPVVPLDFARQLERELAESQKNQPALLLFESMRWACGHKGGSSCEQCFQRVREDLDAWRGCAERLAFNLKEWTQGDGNTIRDHKAIAAFEKLKGSQ